jgi:ribonuclease R
MGKNHVVRPVQPHGTVRGTFRKASGGFGFVRPHAADPLAGTDIFIPAADTGDASSGDEVIVRITKKPRGGGDRGPTGEIVRILERATRQFVGTYFEREGQGFVAVDGTTFNEPISMGDPGAKGARTHDKVVFEMVRFPSPLHPGEGVITEVLGPRGRPGVDTLSIIRSLNLPDKFPVEVLEEARQQAAAFDETDLAGREDLTASLTITIDPADAKDHDDAVALRFDSHRQHWLLEVHIADVAHFVPAGSRLDREAQKRGTSVYLPRLVLPMFPEVISNNLASLQQGKVRYVKSALMEFTHGGQRTHVRFADAAIRVAKRFSYEQVSAILSNDPKAIFVDPPLRDMLERMREFALTLRQRRIKRGALELHMPEAELEFDDEGKLAGAHFLEHDISHQIIEEFMLAANEAVAEQLDELEVAFLRRVHAPPSPIKLREFLEFVEELGYDVAPRRPTDRFQLQRVLTESRDRPEVHAVHYALLRSLKQAEYSPAVEAHYALASDNYCHFTSPIRRYPDLTMHRILGRWLRTGRASSDAQELAALGVHCSLMERRAEQAERELIKLKLLAYLSEHVGLELEIIITAVHGFGFFGQAERLPVEGLVHVSSLVDDYYHYDAATHSLTGQRGKKRFRLGDKVHVKVARVDLQRRELDFQVVAAARPAKKPRRKERS